jgi:hypothetical protein
MHALTKVTTQAAALFALLCMYIYLFRILLLD